jgi:hypothetical protein
MPGRVLAEDFLDDVIAIEGPFDLIKGEQLQALDLVLERRLKFWALLPLAPISPLLPIDRRISLTAEVIEMASYHLLRPRAIWGPWAVRIRYRLYISIAQPLEAYSSNLNVMTIKDK